MGRVKGTFVAVTFLSVLYHYWWLIAAIIITTTIYKKVTA